MKRILARFAVTIWLLCVYAFGQHADNTVTPPKPSHYFNDYASLSDPRTAQQLDQRLEDFERQTSNQILVVIYPALPAEAAIEDFAQDAFRAWKPGQQGRNNGAILFVFVKDRKMRLQTGYGLEGALPDAICKRIISDEIAPRFQSGDFGGGMTAAVNAMIAATRGEYKGTGRTVAEAGAEAHQGEESTVDLTSGSFWWVSDPGCISFLVIVGVVLGIAGLIRGQGGTLYTSSGSCRSGGTWWIGGGGGGGGGFSGGGGGSGGGGASGGW